MKILDRLFKIIAFLMMAFVVIALPFTLLARDIGRVVYNPEVIEAVVNQHLVRIDVMAVLLQGAVNSALAEGSPDDPMSAVTMEAFANMQAEEWVELAKMVMPPQIISAMLNEILSGVFGWIDSPDPVPDITVSIRDMKRIWMQKAVPATELVLNALPQCNTEQLERIPSNWPDGGEYLPPCRPTEPTYSRVLESVASVLPAFLAEIPDEIPLSDSEEVQVDAMRQTQILLRRNRFMARVGWIFVIIVFLVAVVAGSRSLKDVFTWAGWPLMLSGFVMLLFGIIWAEMAPNVFARIRSNFLASTPRVLLSPITGMLQTFAELITDPFWGQGFVLIILGMASIAVAVVLRRVAKKEPSPAVYQLQPDGSTPSIPSDSLQTPSQTGPSPPKWGQAALDEDDDGERPSGMFG